MDTLKEVYPQGDAPLLETQAEIMSRSGQQVPEAGTFAMSSTSTLYLALALEELGELLAAHAELFYAVPGTDVYSQLGMSRQDLRNVQEFSSVCKSIAGSLHTCSGLLRRMLAGRPEFLYSLVGVHSSSLEVWAKEYADTLVVSAGYGVASGLPGGALYTETQDSNLSKVNPQTGKIDKDGSGKWVKGPNYRAPDLKSVLFPTQQPDLLAPE